MSFPAIAAVSEGRNPLACSPTHLLASCQIRNFPNEFTEKCFAIFDVSSHVIYLTWYWLLLFFQELSSIIPFTGFWLGQGSQGKSGNLLEAQGKSGKLEIFWKNWKSQGRKFLSICNFLTSIKKPFACVVELYTTISSIYDAIIYI